MRDDSGMTDTQRKEQGEFLATVLMCLIIKVPGHAVETTEVLVGESGECRGREIEIPLRAANAAVDEGHGNGLASP